MSPANGEVAHMVFTVKAKAVTLQKIKYKKEGKLIVIPKGSDIEVDEHRLIALVKGDHVEVTRQDYKILFPH